MKISFIIIFNHLRLDNLNQTLRFLKKREPDLSDQEIILVCQTSCDSNDIQVDFKNLKLLNLNLDTYKKPYMTNYGVSQSNGKILVLLDSDRILPNQYFTKYTNEIKPNQVLSTYKLYWLIQKYNDEEIENNKIETLENFKSQDNSLNNKNIFSGNTIIHKKDYLKVNGYDEKYIGYGYADNDMTMKCLTNKYEFIWNEEKEYHLNHQRAIIYNNDVVNKEIFKIISAINGLRYCKKWKLTINHSLSNTCYEIEQDFNSFPKQLRINYLFYKNGLF